jgi:hypothetical protein
MKLRTSIAAAGAAALVGSGAFAIPALASSQAATHTLRFISVTKKFVALSKTSVIVQETDVNKAGKIVGFDEIYGVAESATTSAANVSVATAGGMLYGTFILHLKTGAVTNGKITGGTGAFKGATGTFTGKSVSSSSTAVPLTYRT